MYFCLYAFAVCANVRAKLWISLSNGGGAHSSAYWHTRGKHNMCRNPGLRMKDNGSRSLIKQEGLYATLSDAFDINCETCVWFN